MRFVALLLLLFLPGFAGAVVPCAHYYEWLQGNAMKIELVDEVLAQKKPTLVKREYKHTFPDAGPISYRRYRLLARSERSAKPIDLLIDGSFSEQESASLRLGAAKLVTKLPRAQIDAMDEVVVNNRVNGADEFWRNAYPGFTEAVASADGKSKSAHFFVSSLDGLRGSAPRRVKTIRHELGHLIAVKYFGTADPPLGWREAMAKDKNFISDYAQMHPREDWSESLAYYVFTRAGVHGENERGKYSHRFGFLDKYFHPRKSDRDSPHDDFESITIPRVKTRRGYERITFAMVPALGAVLIYPELLPNEGQE